MRKGSNPFEDTNITPIILIILKSENIKTHMNI